MIGIHIENLTRTYHLRTQTVTALKDVSITIPDGRFVAIVGYSGCGKTTLLRLIAGLEAPDGGHIALSERDGVALAACRMGMVFQDHRLLPWLTVRENIGLATRRLALAARDPQRTDDVLHSVGLDGFADALPAQLSGGMAQRAALARALIRDPDLLLMDEPFGALDALTRIHLQDQLEKIWLSRGMTVVFVTHDVGEAVRLADTVIVMAEGRILDCVPVDLDRPRDPLNPEFFRPRNRVMETILGGRPFCHMEERENEDSTVFHAIDGDCRNRASFGARRLGGG